MEIRQLETFRTVARTSSFSRAAVTLNYAQSSISAQIQSLEEEVGVNLFDRLGRTTVLTDAGQRLLTYAERILGLVEEAKAVVPSNGETMGTLTIGAPESICTYRLPPVLQAFRAQFPRVELIFRPMFSVTEWEGLLRNGVADAAIIIDEPHHPPSLIVETLLLEPILLLANPEHPLTQAHAVMPADLREETLLLTEGGCSYRAVLDRCLQAAHIRPGVIMEFHSLEALKQCALAGMGLAYLPAMAVQNEVAQGRLVVLPWCEADYKMPTMLCWHKDKWLSPALRAFLEVTRAVLTSSARKEGV